MFWGEDFRCNLREWVRFWYRPCRGLYLLSRWWIRLKLYFLLLTWRWFHLCLHNLWFNLLHWLFIILVIDLVIVASQRCNSLHIHFISIVMCLYWLFVDICLWFTLSRLFELFCLLLYWLLNRLIDRFLWLVIIVVVRHFVLLLHIKWWLLFLIAVVIHWLGVHYMVQIRLLVISPTLVLGYWSKRYSFWLNLLLGHDNYFKREGVWLKETSKTYFSLGG